MKKKFFAVSSLDEAYEDIDLDKVKDAELFAKKIIANIARGEKHIAITLKNIGVIGFAHELCRYILSEKGLNTSGDKVEKDILLTKKQAMEKLNVSSTTLWQWAKDQYLVPVKIGRKIYYRLDDINKLLNGK